MALLAISAAAGAFVTIELPIAVTMRGLRSPPAKKPRVVAN